MEFQLEIWLQDFTKKLFDEFSSRIKFIGLQGSYNRGEATPESGDLYTTLHQALTFVKKSTSL